MPRSPKLNRMASAHLHSYIPPQLTDRGLLPGPYRSMAQPIRTAPGIPRSAWRCLLVSPHNGCRRHRRCEIIRTSFASPPSGPPPQPSSEQVKFLFLLRALARLSLQIVGTHGSCVRVNSWKSGSTFGRTGRASLHSGGSVSELQLAAPVRMAGALRKAGEAAAKLRRPGAAVSERSEFCRSSRSAATLAVKLFSAPLGLLVLFGPRKERTPRYGSMFGIHAP